MIMEMFDSRNAHKNGYLVIVDRLLKDYRFDMLFTDAEFRMIRPYLTDICLALQDLSALLTLTILDALFYNDITMHKKWLLITTIKHFHK